MTNPMDGGRFDFAARAFEHKASAETHRLRAELTTDLMMKAVHIAAATTYEAMAREIDKTAKRIADIDRATASARARISAPGKSPLPPDATPEPAPEVQEPDHNS